MLAWLAVVQDYAVLGSHGPLVQSAYTPRLLQPLDLVPTPSIIAGMEPHLQACWPAALRALAAILPQASGESSLLLHDRSLCEMHFHFHLNHQLTVPLLSQLNAWCIKLSDRSCAVRPVEVQDIVQLFPTRYLLGLLF